MNAKAKIKKITKMRQNYVKMNNFKFAKMKISKSAKMKKMNAYNAQLPMKFYNAKA